ncbi:MAG: hypothetical protein AAGF97_00400 [Planctomycetota bacterium]
MKHVAPLLLCLCTTLFGAVASADEDLLAQLYGEGVHEYFDGDWCEAEEFFNQAISYGYKDPRCYYFRAFLKMSQGRDYEAEQDIELGARYELEGRGTYDVGRALQRIQGYQRIRFERLRRKAKIQLIQSRSVPSTILPSTDGTVVPGLPVIPPGISDPFSDEEEPEVPVQDVEPEIDGDDMFSDDPMADDGDPEADMFDDRSDDIMDDAGGLDDGSDDTSDDEDPFGDPFGTDEEDPFG